MTARPYSHVLRGQRGAAARTKYLAYLEGLAVPDKTNQTPKNRPVRNTLYVKPFTVDLGADSYLECSALDTSYTKLKAAIGTTRLLDTLPTGKNGLKLTGSKAARISASSGRTPTGTYKQSKRTGLWHIDYGGNSYSAPFGVGTANEKESDAFNAIKTALGTAYSGIHLIGEKI
jgi:hypothetical protein